VAVLVRQFEFLEWTGENHLRHSSSSPYVKDKSAKIVVRDLPFRARPTPPVLGIAAVAGGVMLLIAGVRKHA
jgi:hypothetical protein